MGIAIAALVAGCGSGGSRPTVLAAASLAKVFPKVDPNARYTFASSGALATDIERGTPADVFAAASSKQPDALYAKGLIEKPVEFATNMLALIVPKGNPAHITSVGDITKPGVKVVICNASVPCGDYARTAFANLNITAAAMRNVASEATDVTQVLADVALGQADAGFAYVTDADAAKSKVLAIALPARARPLVADFIAVVRSGRNPGAASAFLRRVRSPEGQATFRADGFGRP